MRLYVRDLRAPESGRGVVLADRGHSWDVFFETGHRRQVDKASATVERVAGPTDSALLNAAALVPLDRWARAHHSVYVVELDREAAREEAFAQANPDMVDGAPCVYVGLTGLTPEARFRNHRKGRKAARIVEKYGRRLLPGLYRLYNPVPFEVGKVLEPWLAARLRERRFGVWQN